MIRIGTLGSMVECGIEKKVTDFSHIGGTLTVGIPQGVHLKLKYVQFNDEVVNLFHSLSVQK